MLRSSKKKHAACIAASASLKFWLSRILSTIFSNIKEKGKQSGEILACLILQDFTAVSLPIPQDLNKKNALWKFIDIHGKGCTASPQLF